MFFHSYYARSDGHCPAHPGVRISMPRQHVNARSERLLFGSATSGIQNRGPRGFFGGCLLRGSSIRADADPDQVARHLREILPPDAQVLTRAELFEHETNHWVTLTSTGLIFGFGVIVALIVGLVILNQTLSTQITRQLPQYATLKAMGYTDRDLTDIVVTLAVIMSTIGFIPASAMATVLYAVVRRLTILPIEMTSARMVGVLAIAWIISVLSALLALRVMRRADPVDLF